MPASLEMKRVSIETAPGLLAFLCEVETADEAGWFRPHPFTEASIAALCSTDVSDLYYVLVIDQRVIGYGLLRGWDEGYDVPSLGVAIDPEFRGLGLGSLTMRFLHIAARLHGATRVRLRVAADNHTAIAVYARMGYVFDDVDPAIPGLRQLVGFKVIGG